MTTLNERLRRAKGKWATAEELAALTNLTGGLPEPLMVALTTLDLSGAHFVLSPSDDCSGLGASMQVFRPAEAAEEGREFYPGIAAVRSRYVPFAMCLEGSGDPYFFRSDEAIVRIPHEAVDLETNGVIEEQIELVSASLAELFARGLPREAPGDV